MSDPSPNEEEAPLFAYSTSRLAGETAALASRSRRATILQLLHQHGPLTLFELAALMQVRDHQISGRITDLKRDGKIEETGQRRTKPETGCSAEVYRLADPPPPFTAR